MRILLDHCVPKPIRRYLAGHDVKTAYQMGWQELSNGRLLTEAEHEFDVLLTVDQNINHQQNMAGRQLAIVVLCAADNRLETLLPLVPNLLSILTIVENGKVYRVDVEDTP